MGFFKKMLGISEPDDRSSGDPVPIFSISAAMAGASHDQALYERAERNKGHISLKAVDDEYDRLIIQKYNRR
jgi:hypothetical protein